MWFNDFNDELANSTNPEVISRCTGELEDILRTEQIS